LLITSRDTRRWVLPKGNRINGLEPHRAAAHEAFEEAGISGISCPVPLGTYSYDKRRADGTSTLAKVKVYPLAFTYQFSDWPEMAERDTRWFRLAEAAEMVDEPELQALIRNFSAPDDLGGSRAEGPKGLASRIIQAVLPHRGRFFSQFEEHSQTLVAGADAMGKLLQGIQPIGDCCQEVREQEHRADRITREVLMDVRRTPWPPLDRNVIKGLIGAMDDAIDQMNDCCKAITLYGLTEFDQQMKNMGGIIVEAARVTAEAIPLLRSVRSNGDRLNTLTERLVILEGKADAMHEAGLKAVFSTYGATNPMEFIVRREIYTHLERVIDRFEDVANEIQGIVIGRG